MGTVIGGRGGVAMLRRGASFSSAICSGFCKLDALFVSDGSHAFRAAGRQQQGAASPVSNNCTPRTRRVR